MSGDKLRIGLALGSGGARGVAHIGVLAELERANIEVSHIAGTSAGSLVGALYSYGLSPEQILALAMDTTWKDLIGITIPRLGLSSFERMEAVLNDIFGNANIEELPIPFAAVSCDLRTGKEVVLQQGNIANSIRASCSIPGIFVPVVRGEYVLVDGGIVNGVPVNVARKMNEGAVVAVKLHGGVEPASSLDNIFAVLLQSLEVIQRSQHMATPDVLLEPDICRQYIFDLSRMQEAYLAGRAAAKAALSEIKQKALQLAESRAV